MAAPHEMRVREFRLRRVAVLLREPRKLVRRVVPLWPPERGSELYPLLDPRLVALLRPAVPGKPAQTPYVVGGPLPRLIAR